MQKWFRVGLIVIMFLTMVFPNVSSNLNGSAGDQNAYASGSNTVTIYYKKGYSTPFIHFRQDTGKWTAVPGFRMQDAEVAGFAKYTFSLGTYPSTEVVFNNGSGIWDNNQAKNYTFSAGVYTFTPGSPAGKITAGAPAGAFTPTPLPTVAPTEVPTATPTATVAPTATVQPSASIDPTATVPPTTQPTATATPVPTATPSPIVTPTPTAPSAGNVVTVYYKPGYSQPYIHYVQANSKWTTSPGLKMEPAEIPGYFKAVINIGQLTKLEACFNDGGRYWDSRGGLNYTFSVGTSTYSNGTITTGAPIVATPTPVPSPQDFVIYYKSNGKAAYMHFRPEGGAWTKAPGYMMDSFRSGYVKLALKLTTNKIAEAAFNDGGSIWDNNGGKNYAINPGYTTVENGMASSGQPAITPIYCTVNGVFGPGGIEGELCDPITTPAPTSTPVPTATVTPTETPIATGTPMVTASPEPSATPVPTITPEPTPTVVPTASPEPTPNKFTIYYKSTFGNAYLHYQIDNGTWTVVPGVALSNSEYPGYQKVIISTTGQKITAAAFNNGASIWDNNNTKNYTFNPGTTTVVNKTTFAGAPQLASITVDPNPLTIAVNEKKTLVVNANYADGSSANVADQVQITVTDTTKASVNASNQIVGLAEGNITVDVAYLDKVTTISVNVIPKQATQPTDRTVTSLYLSNWLDTMLIWMNSKIASLDKGGFSGGWAPRISEVRYKNDFTVNLVKEYAGFFRDETKGVKYTDGAITNAEVYFDEEGIMRSKYTNYGSSKMPVTVTKDFATVPNQNFTVATYTFKNDTANPIDYNLLESLMLSNKTQGSTNKWHHGWYDPTRKTIFVDMSSAGQYAMALTAMEEPNSFTVGDASITNTNDASASAWSTFNATGTLKNTVDKWALNMSVGFQNRFIIPPYSEVTRSFVLTVNSSVVSAQAAVDVLREKSAEQWLEHTKAVYRNWLNGPGKKTVNFDDNGLNLMYKRGLVSIKNSTNPVTGAMPATTNPFNYSYKVWARDSAVTAIILDKAGFHEEAERYWYWLKDRIRDVGDPKGAGTVGTCFNIWNSNWVQFVEPEHDSIGIFLTGIYQHYKLTGNKKFLDDMWYKANLSASFIANTMNNRGYAAADSSIWEENIEYNSFTQATYIAGLNAAQYMAKARGDIAKADTWNGIASTIRSSIQRDTSNNQGMWNGQYYNRAIYTDFSVNRLVDSSSNLLMVLGIVDPESSRAVSHFTKVKQELLHDNFGIARYNGDIFYNTSPWSPSGDEAKSDEPTWPQMSMYMALSHLQRGEKDAALDYLKWMASRTSVGYMAQGESVSRIDLKPLISTSVEPVTAAWFIVTALAYEGKTDMKMLPYQYNAGFNKTINLAGAATQWSNVPYFLDDLQDATDSNFDIKRTYVSNDAQNLYVRVKTNNPNTLTNDVAVQIYAEDFKNSAAPTKTDSIAGGTLERGMQYMVEFANGNANLKRYKVVNGVWQADATNAASTLRYNASTGEYMISIPLSLFSSTSVVSTGDWTNLNVVLAHQSNGAWVHNDLAALHYRYTTSEAPLYGNVE